MRAPAARSLSLALAAAAFGASAAAQAPKMPDLTETRFVDFHRDLARKDVVVVIGTLGKAKEGKRVADGKAEVVGSDGATVKATFFKVAMQAKVEARVALAGDADKVVIAYELRIAKLPGDQQHQESKIVGASMTEGMLAMFVLAPRDKGDGHSLVHVIECKSFAQRSPDKEAVFVETVRDFYAINRRMLDLGNALEASEKAQDDEARRSALKSLQKLVDDPLRLLRAQSDKLIAEHVAPLEARAKKRLAEAGTPPPTEK